MKDKEIHDVLFKDLCDGIGREFVFNRSEDSLPSVEIHPEAVRKAVLFLRESCGVDFLDSIDAADLLGYSGPVTDRSLVPWSSYYSVAEISMTKESDEESQAKQVASRFFLLQYQFFSFEKKLHYILKSILPFENPVVESVDDLFGNANWLEREIWDLLGIRFSNSRDLRRILMPEDWEGHPLRRDYVQPVSYCGMSTSRPSPLEAVTRTSIENVKKWTDEV